MKSSKSYKREALFVSALLALIVAIIFLPGCGGSSTGTNFGGKGKALVVDGTVTFTNGVPVANVAIRDIGTGATSTSQVDGTYRLETSNIGLLTLSVTSGSVTEEFNLGETLVDLQSVTVSFLIDSVSGDISVDENSLEVGLSTTPVSATDPASNNQQSNSGGNGSNNNSTAAPSGNEAFVEEVEKTNNLPPAGAGAGGFQVVPPPGSSDTSAGQSGSGPSGNPIGGAGSGSGSGSSGGGAGGSIAGGSGSSSSSSSSSSSAYSRDR